jgi:hypothetical protein
MYTLVNAVEEVFTVYFENHMRQNYSNHTAWSKHKVLNVKTCCTCSSKHCT